MAHNRSSHKGLRRPVRAVLLFAVLLALFAWWSPPITHATPPLSSARPTPLPRPQSERSGVPLVSPTPPAQKSVLWLHVNVNITVHDDGTFTVEEELQVRFLGGPFSSGYRSIPLDKVVDITDIRLEDDAGPYTQADTGDDHTFSITRERGEMFIRWHFAPLTDERRTFTLTYRVHGGLRAYPGGDQLWWKAVFPDREGAVILSTVTVTVPGPVQAYAAYYVPAEVELLDERTVRFVAEQPIAPGNAFEVRVQWPHGVIPVTPAPWQAKADRNTWRIGLSHAWRTRAVPLLEVGMVFGSVTFVALSLAALLLIWYLYGRDRPVPRIDYLREPPSDLSPALAGQLVDAFMKPRHVLATILDLARRGFLEIEERPVRGAKKHDYLFRLLQEERGPLLPFEQRTLYAFMARSREKRLKDIRERFHKHVRKIEQAQEEELVRRHLFPTPPSEAGALHWLVGNVLIALGLLAFFFFSMSGFARLGLSDRFGILLFASLLVVGVATRVAGRFMAKRTDVGAEEAEKWRAFRRYLHNLERMAEITPARARLERYLPYAVAFGVEKRFLHAWERLAKETDGDMWPSWYHPTVTAAHSSTPGGGGASAQSIGARLSAMSAGLATMLNEASSALSSSGGGFSGGGSGGGGGGGGGSGGFG